MFCYQCEQTAKSVACTVKGVCGKEDQVASLQDALIYTLKGLALLVEQAAPRGLVPAGTYPFMAGSLFATLTNVNFDPQVIAQRIHEAASRRDALKDALLRKHAGATFPETPVAFVPADTVEALADQGREHGINAEASADPNIRSLQHAVLYGLKGVAAYAFHAAELDYRKKSVDDYLVEALVGLARFNEGDLNAWIGKVLRCGEINFEVIELLDRANTETFGTPVPTEVPLGVKAGKAILVSGHDFLDLQALLKQTEGKGITVYTHGEMLPAHGYPMLKKYGHLVGNYGGAWQEQQKEFDEFPGAILMTTNCIQKPKESYKARIFTTGLVGWPGVVHVSDQRFGPVIEAALAAPGFAADAPEKKILVGFGRTAVLGVADKVVDLVKDGKIRHFFLVGGCDGAKPGRSYYTEFAKAVPKDSVILTLACGKYRFNKLDFGAIEGIPRLLDIGQCNDAYSAIEIAKALAGVFKTDVNGLPLSLILSWYEQKAVAILLTLLHLDIRNIRVGPSLPAFIGPAAFKVLQDNYRLTPITTPEKDLEAILQVR